MLLLTILDRPPIRKHSLDSQCPHFYIIITLNFMFNLGQASILVKAKERSLMILYIGEPQNCVIGTHAWQTPLHWRTNLNFIELIGRELEDKSQLDDIDFNLVTTLFLRALLSLITILRDASQGDVQHPLSNDSLRAVSSTYPQRAWISIMKYLFCAKKTTKHIQCSTCYHLTFH